MLWNNSRYISGVVWKDISTPGAFGRCKTLCSRGSPGAGKEIEAGRSGQLTGVSIAPPAALSWEALEHGLSSVCCSAASLVSCYVFVFKFLTTSLGMWDLSYLTRDRIPIPCIERWSLNHWTAREVPNPALKLKKLEFRKVTCPKSHCKWATELGIHSVRLQSHTCCSCWIMLMLQVHSGDLGVNPRNLELRNTLDIFESIAQDENSGVRKAY